ncbi:MAG: DUF4962 domain-containing protein [Chitinivibrionales bacterium]|nr:DUF4962 domain-containing protein [Chitinivibrionales bacterium]
MAITISEQYIIGRKAKNTMNARKRLFSVNSVTVLFLAALNLPTAAQHTHPYLYFTSATLSDIKDKLDNEPFATRWSRFISNADGHLTRPVYGFDNTREALGVAGICAFAWAMTGETKYADRAIQEALAIMQESQWHTGYSWNKGADLETAEASAACALVYDWCHDALTSTQRQTFKTNILKKSTNIYLGSIEKHNDWWVTNGVTNWCGVVHGGCGLAALALYDEDPAFSKAADYAFDHLETFLTSVTLQDGGGHEGVMYNRYGTTFANYFFTAATHVFGDDRGVPQKTADKLAGYWYMYLFGPDKKYANFNNMNESTFSGLYGEDHRKWEGGPCAVLCALWEAQSGRSDPLLLWGADNGGAAFYWKGVSPFYFLWRRDAAPAGVKPQLQKAVLFRGAGHAVFDEPDLWLVFNGGWTSNKSHHNMDLGSFVLVAHGERLVHDPGYKHAETADHSTILINGKGQPQNVQGTFLHFGSGASFHYLASDLSNCYEDVLTRFVRHIVMVDGRYIVLLDDLAAASAAAWEWRLQTRHDVTASGSSAQIAGQSKVLHVIAAAPADANASHGTASIEYVALKPAVSRDRETFVTVLYPADAGTSQPPVAWDANGTLSVGSDEIVFSGGPGNRLLARVNGENATALDKAADRTIIALGSTTISNPQSYQPMHFRPLSGNNHLTNPRFGVDGRRRPASARTSGIYFRHGTRLLSVKRVCSPLVRND